MIPQRCGGHGGGVGTTVAMGGGGRLILCNNICMSLSPDMTCGAEMPWLQHNTPITHHSHLTLPPPLTWLILCDDTCRSLSPNMTLAAC